MLFQMEVEQMKAQLLESKAYIEAQEAEERKLLKIISEADAERVRQKKELDQVRLFFCTFQKSTCMLCCGG
jgi:hypothetical protein